MLQSLSRSPVSFYCHGIVYVQYDEAIDNERRHKVFQDQMRRLGAKEWL